MIGLERLEPFVTVLDVGGNVGTFAEAAAELWPGALITSFEPIPGAATANRSRAGGRWQVEQVAISGGHGEAPFRFCRNQPSASTMQEPGTVRLERFGIVDDFEVVQIATRPLDDYLELVAGRTLVKIDVEGHELEVLAGAGAVLELAAAVVVEVNQDPDIFLGAPSPAVVDQELRRHGLELAGVLSAFPDPAGRVIQFDGLWLRQ